MEHKDLLALYKSMKKISDPAFQFKVRKENFVDMDTVWIAGMNGEYDIHIGQGSIIAPNVYFFGKIIIGQDTIIGPNMQLHNVHIGDRCRIGRPQLIDTAIGYNSTIGAFSEMARTIFGHDSGAVHACYLGDTTVGEHTNIGYGTVTANYDGSSVKNKTIIGSRVKTGIGSNLVSKKEKSNPNEPGMLVIGDDAVIGAGATVLADVPANATVIGIWKGDKKDKNENKGEKDD